MQKRISFLMIGIGIFLFVLPSFSPAWASSFGFMPKSWIQPWPENQEKMLEDTNELHEFSKSVQNILSSNQALLENITPQEKSRWHLAAIRTKLAIAKSGLMGFQGLNGRSAVSALWKPVTDNSWKNVSDNNSDTDSQPVAQNETLEIHSGITLQQLDHELLPIVEASVASGKVQDGPHFFQVLRQKSMELLELTAGLDQQPTDFSWWPDKFQLELRVSSSGDIIPTVGIGAQYKVALVWRRITHQKPQARPPQPSPQSPQPTPMQKFVRSLARALVTFDGFDFRYTPYDLNRIRIGVGIGSKGSIYVAKFDANLFGSLSFKKSNTTGLMKSFPSSPMIENDYIYLQDEISSNNIQYAQKNKVELELELVTNENNSNLDKSATSMSPESALYQLPVDKFREGLKDSAQMAKFLLTIAGYVVPKSWTLDGLGLSYELFISGKMGFATVSGSATTDLEFVRRK